MTITKHTPVVPTDAAFAQLQKLIDRQLVDLRRQNPPRWLDEWIDLDLYRSSTPAERREIAADGLERQAQADAAQREEEPGHALPEDQQAQPSKARPVRILPTRRVRPGTPYVPCAGGCEHMHLRSRPALAYCNGCEPSRRKPVTTDDLY